MILTDKEILNRLKKQEITIKPLPTQEQIQPTSIDLRLSNDYLSPIRTEQAIDLKNEEQKYQQLTASALILPAGEFVLASTKEWIEVPKNLTARVEGRSSIGRLGIAIHVTAGFIDAGFKGNITLEIKNLSNNSLILHEGMRICQIVFEELTGEPTRVYGEAGNKYQGQKGTTPSLIYYDEDNVPNGA
ncbi:dCTP deaminase [Methanobrevibacter sp.]